MSSAGRAPQQIAHFAARAGISADEWERRRAAGLRRCWACTEWKGEREFSPKSERCRPCHAAAARERRRRHTPEQRAQARQRDAEQQRERRRRVAEREHREVVLERARAVVAGIAEPWPPTRVRLRLAAARRAALPFDVAWEVALGLLRGEWGEVLEATRSAWQDAYERRPTAGLDALAAVEGVGAADDAERISGPVRGSLVAS